MSLTNEQLDFQTAMLQRLLSTHSSMVQGMQNSDRLLEDLPMTEKRLEESFSTLSLTLKNLSNELSAQVAKAGSEVWTVAK